MEGVNLLFFSTSDKIIEIYSYSNEQIKSQHMNFMLSKGYEVREENDMYYYSKLNKKLLTKEVKDKWTIEVYLAEIGLEFKIYEDNKLVKVLELQNKSRNIDKILELEFNKIGITNFDINSLFKKIIIENYFNFNFIK